MLTFFLPEIIKVVVLILIALIFVLHESKIVKLKIPQNHWQVPSNWLGGNPKKDMVLWGIILGAGIFTYIPHISFHLLYLYTGMLSEPINGLYLGAIYGFSRTIPAALIAVTRIINYESTLQLKGNNTLMIFGRFFNLFILLLLIGFLYVNNLELSL
ncbi:hypothetical protein [Bacillus sp. FJAT-27445]|uniref:hypothetical protein n=1 Tax=Bacillus sp. FJAT-27445 TaxID=1679166 RepID=UPI0012E3DBFF|nr:hypothetical protein [Bacillus sp. FJAT-27445]